MREIRFRGKRIDNDAWIYGGYHVHEDKALCIASKEDHAKNIKYLIVTDGMADWNLSVPINCYEVRPETIGQLTGIKDKNGEDIFEGDIVSRPIYQPPAEYCGEEEFEVVYAEAWGGFGISDGGAFWHIDNNDEFTVVGNIYENKTK